MMLLDNDSSGIAMGDLIVDDNMVRSFDMDGETPTSFTQFTLSAEKKSKLITITLSYKGN